MRKLFEKFSNMKLLYKLLTVYFFVFVVIILFSLILFGYSATIIREETKFASEQLTRQISVNLEQDLSTTTNNLFGTYNLILLGDNLSVPLAYGEDAAYKNNIRGYSIRRALNEYLYSTSFINWIGVIDTNDYIYTSVRPTKDIAYNLEENMQRDRQDCIEAGGKILWRVLEDGTISLSRLIYNNATMQYTGYVVVNINPQIFYDTLNSFGILGGVNLIIYDSFSMPMLYYLSEDLESAMITLPSQERDYISVDGQTYVFSKEMITKSGLELIKLTNISANAAKIEDLTKVFVLTCICCLLLISLLTTLVLSSISKNIRILMGGIEQVSSGDLSVQIQPVSNDEIGEIAVSFNQMTEQMNRLVGEVKKEARLRQQKDYQLLEAKYQALQSQINPHFMFNALESINGIAKINQDNEISSLIQKLALLLRDNLDRSGTFCPLAEEIEYIMNYLDLFRQIYPSKLVIVNKHDPDLDTVAVPTFILQPIVENAVVHGIGQKVGKGVITISTRIYNDVLQISVTDDGVGMSPQTVRQALNPKENRKHIGLNNVNERIHLLYNEDIYGMEVTSEPGKGTTVSICLPI
ncbi:sensor histidine kinase [Youxingia wuxianensis]|uniref:histidine kinase n=1 Tax=Youxingia wuxianensis TaxID=2763678 RepID=A0A926ENW5_9FIRM|nr:sensor histidine kinase [Youxingia wuxianensis]MBC8585096.1 sensor histidine kinase [Youxingia wuxianensis]